MGNPFVRFHLVTLKCQYQGKSDCEGLYRKGAELGYMLLLNTTRKPYMGSPIAPSHLTLGDLERSKIKVLKMD